MTVANVTIIHFAMSVLIEPFSQEFGGGRMTVSTAIMLATLLAALATPVMGRLLDRWGIRPVTLSAIVVFSAAIVVMSLAPISATVFIGLFAFVGLCSAGHSAGLRAFGQVYGYLFMAFAIGGSLGPLAMGLSFDHFGSYRTALSDFFSRCCWWPFTY